MKPKAMFLLLLVSLCVLRTSLTVSKINESEVKSFVVERRAIGGYDLFTVNMKSNYQCTDATVSDWCRSLGGYWAHQLSWQNKSSCSCTCLASLFSFVPRMQTCINATQAASFGGECETNRNK